MESEKVLRKKQRALLTKLRESYIFSVPLTLTTDIGRFEVTPFHVTEANPRSLDLRREIAFSISPQAESAIAPTTTASILVEVSGELFVLPLDDTHLSGPGTCIGTFTLSAARLSNRRKKDRKKENVSYFSPILLYTNDTEKYPIDGYARIIDSDDNALCLNLHFFHMLEEQDFTNSEILFQERPFGAYPRKQKIIRTRNFVRHRHPESPITKLDAVLELPAASSWSTGRRAAIQPTTPVTIELECLLHEPKTLRASLSELLTDGFLLTLPHHELESIPTQLQVDHKVTRTRFNAIKLADRLFVSYQGISLGSKTVWFNFITRYGLGHDHCFTPRDTGKLIHLMFESGNYTSKAILELSLMSDYFKHKWPVEESFSPTKYRWLVRDRQGNYIGHTAAVRASESLWGAIDNIGSQSYNGSWNAEFVANWIRSLAELLTHQGQSSWIQWTFVPQAGVWTRFDEIIQSKENLSITRDRFWGLFLLNRKKIIPTTRGAYRSRKLGAPIASDSNLLTNLPDSQKTLLELLCDGLQSNSSFQIDFEKEYGFKLIRHFHLIEGDEGRFLLTFTNYPAWASLHKGHDWDYLFPLDEIQAIRNESELLTLIEETIFDSGCTPYRLAVVSPSIRLTSGVEWTNLSLHPDALEFAARSLEEA